MKAADIYQGVTDRLIAELEAGQRNPQGWTKPWASLGSFNQRNATTKKNYQGFNWFWLALVSQDKGYSSPEWATFKQWETLGATVNKGEKATHLIKWVERVCKDHGPNELCTKCGTGFPCGFAVFNSEQVSGYVYEAPAPKTEIQRIERLEAFSGALVADGITLSHGGGRAFYMRSADSITLPEFEHFKTAGAYYSTLLHEASHSTGHESRCDRERLATRFGDEHYAIEELIAELSAAFLCAQFDVAEPAGSEHGDYIANWLRALKADSKLIATVASKAQASATYWASRVPASTLVEVAA